MSTDGPLVNPTNMFFPALLQSFDILHCVTLDILEQGWQTTAVAKSSLVSLHNLKAGKCFFFLKG